MSQLHRIMGTEVEFGAAEIHIEDHDGVNILGGKVEPQFHQNGARIYRDKGGYPLEFDHLEFATPETSNPLDALIFEKAGERICREGRFASGIIKNNRDAYGASFGCHENYFSRLSPHRSVELLPFLVTRQIYAGAGWINDDGEFELSQRASVMRVPCSSGTLAKRGIINARDERLSDINGFRRLHLIVGDSNMCEAAIFLKMGATSLVLSLLEEGKGPAFPYDEKFAIEDISRVSCEGPRAVIKGAEVKGLNAIAVQRVYLEACRGAYSGVDPVMDQVMELWEEVLCGLEEPSDRLFGLVDWYTKKQILDEFALSERLGLGDWSVRSNDLAYHALDPDESLYQALMDAGLIHRICTDAQIEQATKLPPADTRANIRGRVVGLALDVLSEEDLYMSEFYWTTIRIIRDGLSFFDEFLADPRVPYRRRLQRFIDKLCK